MTLARKSILTSAALCPFSTTCCTHPAYRWVKRFIMAVLNTLLMFRSFGCRSPVQLVVTKTYSMLFAASFCRRLFVRCAAKMSKMQSAC
uniref:Putative secreted protein n=1 Tax=Ixodes ricinus TaxID=34613 RepID=A0A6B0UAF3_IXORI